MRIFNYAYINEIKMKKEEDIKKEAIFTFEKRKDPYFTEMGQKKMYF